MKFLFLIFLCTNVLGQQLTLQWDAPTNMPPASFGYAVIESDANDVVQFMWATSNTNFVTPSIPIGISRWRAAQNPANSWGDGWPMLFSNEIEIQNTPNAVVTATGTNSLIQTSTDLGTTWQVAGTNVVVFPLLGSSRKFFTSPGQKVSITVSNSMKLVSP
jgi:hypothetical protein